MSDARVLAEARRELDDAGLTGWFCLRDLATRREIALDADVAVPVASLVKVPLAMAVLERIEHGDLDAAEQVEVSPLPAPVAGLTGLSRFVHPSRVALQDLVRLSTTLSDNVAADLLFERVSPDEVTAWLRDHGIDDVVVRHAIGDLAETPLRDSPELAHALAIAGGVGRLGHRVDQLDPSSASLGTARAMVDLLAVVWADDGPAAAQVRGLMGEAVHRQRLWPDFASDASTWSGKTGTLLNLRHEIGVVDHADGTSIAIAALTTSRVPAAVQPHAEATMGAVARRLHDHLRSR